MKPGEVMPMVPSLPQNDGPAERAKRNLQLQRAQHELVYDHSTTIAPLGVAESLPRGDGFSPLLLGGAGTVVLALIDDVLSMASILLAGRAPGSPLEDMSDEDYEAAGDALDDLRSYREALRAEQDLAVRDQRPASSSVFGRGLSAIGGALERVTGQQSGAVDSALEALDSGVTTLETERATRKAGGGPLEMLDGSIGILFKLVLRRILREIGLYGDAQDIYAFVRQFNIRVPPTVVSQWDLDAWFARLRVAGPNPMVIKGISALPANFPVTDAQYQSVMGASDSLAAAGAQGRLYLCDYAALADVQTGKWPDGQKYLTAPLVLLATPAAGSGDRALRAVAIQLGQQPGTSTPIFLPSDGLAWRLAQVHVNCADGNYHELISHLGLTHLVVEEFAMATPRQLAPEHPIYVLLTPHLQGTLAINNSAVTSLIAPGGTVDRLLAGTIQASTRVSVDAVLAADLRQMAVPVALEARKVLDVAGLPEFPYRDDALLLWGAISGWVVKYLNIYYTSADDIIADYELKGWLAELASSEGGGLQGIPSWPPSFEQLATLVSTVVFTASVQHAAVNFPQASVMAFTPAMPLACYEAPPTSTTVTEGRGGPLDPRTDPVLRTMPPLQDGFVQNALGSLLGGVYFTRLGDYDRYMRGSYFQDDRVSEPLADFQQALIRIESEIGQRNLRRVSYTTLLPTSIPQSINI